MRDKSVVLALVLTFFLGPIGLLYASVPAAVALVVLAAAGVVPTFGFVLIFVWPASMAWAAIAASSKHKAFLHEKGLHEKGLHEKGLHEKGLHEKGLHEKGLHEKGLQGTALGTGTPAGIH